MIHLRCNFIYIYMYIPLYTCVYIESFVAICERFRTIKIKWNGLINLNPVSIWFCSSDSQFLSLAGSSRLHEASWFHCWNRQTLGECLHHGCIDQIFYAPFLCMSCFTRWGSSVLELWKVNLFVAFRVTSMTGTDSWCPSTPRCFAQKWNFTPRWVVSLSSILHYETVFLSWAGDGLGRGWFLWNKGFILLVYSSSVFSTWKSHQTWRSPTKSWSALQELMLIMCEFAFVFYFFIAATQN